MICAYRYTRQKHRNIVMRTKNYTEMVRWLARTRKARHAATNNLWLESEYKPATTLKTRRCRTWLAR